jgi:hypothetical protein
MGEGEPDIDIYVSSGRRKEMLSKFSPCCFKQLFL